MAIDDPNVVLPLATSYNERGVAGYTHTVTNGEDQRKINCFYEVAKNPLTGKGTLTLSKRPGVTLSPTTLGTAGQAAFLILNLNKYNSIADSLVFSSFNGQVYSSTVANGDVVIDSAVSLAAYCDVTFVTASLGSVQAVVQLVSGSGTGVAQRVFFSPSGASWTQITDGDFTGLFHVGKMEHLDGFAFIVDAATNRIYNSDVNSLANWTSSSFIAKQIRQDNAMGLARLSNKILAFGEETVEAFYNAGNTVGSPLGRITQLHTRIGLVPTATVKGTHYYCTVGGVLYFVGRYARGTSCGLFAFDGQSFEKVSSTYIDKIISEKYSSYYSINSITVNGQAMVAICFSSPGASPQIALVFSIDWKEWFEWNSSVFCPVNNGQFYLGVGSNQNRIYSFNNSDNWQDNGTSYQWLTQFRLPTNGSSVKRMLMYGVDADTDTSASSISVDVSDDDCQSFSSLQAIDLTRERKVNFRGGSYTRRHVRLSATDARPKRIANFIANVSD